MRKIAGSAITAALTLIGVADPASAAITRASFGTLADGTPIEALTLSNARGVSARIITYGATLQALSGPDRSGKVADVLLGYDTLTGFVDTPNYFGVTVGRYANRIAGAAFTLDGKPYKLSLNDKTNTLHGGTRGFDKVAWKVVSVDQAANRVTLGYTSPDGEEGYPGKLDVTVSYSLDADNALAIEFKASTDKPTVVNMTNHAIFNLAGEGSPGGILAHRLTISARAYTPVNATLIPTGELKPVAGTVFDFTRPRIVGADLRDGRDQQIVYGRGYDHNFALDAGLTTAPKLAARLEDPASGRVLEVLTTEPGVQFYSGNFLDGTLVGKSGHVYRMGDGIALEPQKFPDSPNQPKFPTARVDPGKPYRHLMIYRLSTAR